MSSMSLKTLDSLLCSLLLMGGLSSAVFCSPGDSTLPAKSFKELLLDTPDPARLRATHGVLCSQVHTTGTPGERRTLETLESLLTEAGLEVVREDVYPYLAFQGEAQVEVLAAGKRLPLRLKERSLPEDPYSGDPQTLPGWNAYSGTGEVRAKVVYANYARREDFAFLEKKGIAVQGKIVIARYGRIFRGKKVLFAERAGAVGLLLYTDPDDDGYRRGIPYPEGGWANEDYIQRGSLLALSYPGDPLTPGTPATKSASRLTPEKIALPYIPVQPLGWGAAREILSRMRGSGVPPSWQGGLPFAYRFEGGDALAVRLMVRQQRRIARATNLLGILRGGGHPDQLVIVGCHFDAWTFGAGDPNAGTIILLEMARSFGEAARAGLRPDRTIIFANWTGEEFGMLGSTEYCEAHRDLLDKRTVAYINLDMAAMGSEFGASAQPLLSTILRRAASEVPQTGRHGRLSVLEAWKTRVGHPVVIAEPGGGSDHLAFMAHLGIPVASFGGGGSPGVSYHSNYETLSWYHKVVGSDYESARMLTRIGNMLVMHLANDPIVPLDPTRYAPALRRHIDAYLARRVGSDSADDITRSRELFAPLYARIDALEKAAQRLSTILPQLAESPATTDQANRTLISLERSWLSDTGLPGRPWYRSLYSATDPSTGYGALPLPLLVRDGMPVKGDALREAIARYGVIVYHLETALSSLSQAHIPPLN